MDKRTRRDVDAVTAVFSDGEVHLRNKLGDIGTAQQKIATSCFHTEPAVAVCPGWLKMLVTAFMVHSFTAKWQALLFLLHLVYVRQGRV